MTELTARETEILKTLVLLSEITPHTTFDIPPDADRLDVPTWPKDGPQPSREEVRGLVAREFLEIGKSAHPAWRFWPSEQARAAFGNNSEQVLAQAFQDPDQRLGVILDAIVNATAVAPPVR